MFINLLPCRLLGGVLAFLVAGAVPAQPTAPSAHAYSGEAAMARLMRRNLAAETELPIVGPPPAPSGRITRVVYAWRYVAPPRELRVQLCQRGGRCVDVSSSPDGVTEAFLGASPANAFYFRAVVEGRGALAPLAGQTGRVIVNWVE